MRHIRTRRRFRVILILLFTICFIVLIENRIEGLAPRLKSMAEAKVEDALGGKADFFIGSIGGGLVHPIVLSDIRIKQRDPSQLLQSLVIDSIRTNYYIKDIVGALTGSDLPPLLDKNSTTYVNFSMKRGEIKGFFGLYGDLSDAKINGYVILSGKYKISIIGHIRNGKFDAEIRPEMAGTGSIRIYGVMSQEGAFTVNLKLDHLTLGGYDVVCDAILKNKIIPGSEASDASDGMDGEFETRKLIVNFKPFVDIKTHYKLRRNTFEITDFAMGDLFKAYGTVRLGQPGEIDLTVLANNVNLSWAAQMFGNKDTASGLIGTMNGKFEFKGPLKKINTSSTFDIRSGKISVLSFEYMTMTIKGDLPFVKIEDSRIIRSGGSIGLYGEFDLRRIGKASIFDNVKLTADDRAITWDEWSSAQGNDVEELTMKKNFGDQFGFGYKKFVKEGKIDESVRDSDEAHFDYNLQPNDSIKVMVAQDKDFFGFEHKDKF